MGGPDTACGAAEFDGRRRELGRSADLKVRRSEVQDGVALSSRVAPVNSPCNFTVAGTVTTAHTVSLGTANYIELALTKNTPTASVALNGLTVFGTTSLGNVVNNSGGDTDLWHITGETLTSGFTLTAVLAVSAATGGDAVNVDVLVGYVAPPDNVGPATSNVDINPKPVILNGQATVTANVDDTTKGGSAILSATYMVDGGSPATMTAQDGTFDEVVEDLEATFRRPRWEHARSASLARMSWEYGVTPSARSSWSPTLSLASSVRSTTNS